MQITRLAVFTLTALAFAAPASAQFGGLKKALKGKAADDGATQAPAGQGTVVLTPDVVNKLLTGLKAGQAERALAATEDTPYGRYQKADQAYTDAQPKCQAEQQAFFQRSAADKKLSDKYSAYTEKMVAAQSKGDIKLMTAYQDSALALQGPHCVVKKPEQPKDYYDSERALETRAEQAELKASSLSANELAMVKERTDAILRGATASDISASEKSAVAAKASELKPLMGIQEVPPARAQKAAPAPAPAPAPTPAPAAATAAPANPPTSAAASDLNSCMMRNMQAHQAELQALGKEAQAAQAAGDQSKLMAIADSAQKIQMAGCMAR